LAEKMRSAEENLSQSDGFFSAKRQSSVKMRVVGLPRGRGDGVPMVPMARSNATFRVG
jgi:hypothetical protein